MKGRLKRISGLIAIAIVVSACVTSGSTPRTNLCRALTKFAAAETHSGGGAVKIGRTGQWLVDHAKYCEKKDEDPAAVAFCTYLMEETSTEFMEATVNDSMACLQGQRIVGFTGNTGIANWDGNAHFFAPRLEAESADVELTWHLTSFGAWDDFVEFKVQTNK
jgi:hypothetical protein